jgi:hypothetical protein
VVNRWIWLASYLLVLIVVSLGAMGCTPDSPARTALDALCDSREGFDQVQAAVKDGDLHQGVALLRAYVESHPEDTQARDVLRLLAAELAKLAVPN